VSKRRRWIAAIATLVVFLAVGCETTEYNDDPTTPVTTDVP
jgi:predicted component of type VI protein secretion system